MTVRRHRSVWRGLSGPQELGHGPIFWTSFGVVGLGLLFYPSVGSVFALSNLANFGLYVPMGLGLALLWGYNGVLSFGQGAFFGIAGYVYGIIAGNVAGVTGGTLLAAAGGIAAAVIVAAAFGYFVFYGQVSAWIIPLLTLVLSLILETFMAQTAGYQWRVGRVLLGGYNGMTGIPPLQIGSVQFGGASTGFYFLVVGLMLLTYLALRLLVNSRYGHVVVGIRDDAERTRMLGHNVGLIQVRVFTLGAALAALSGVLYVSWGNYMSPSSMGLLAATLPVIWTAVGGRHSLLAVLLSTVALRWLADALAVRGGEYAFLILGALLLTTMLFFPAGIVVTIARRWSRPGQRGSLARLKPGTNDSWMTGLTGEGGGAEVLLRAENLTKSFGGIRAVDHVSFTVARGELRCLIGPNGAGKSTLFSLLSGLQKPDAGRIVLKDEDITYLSPYRRVRKGVCQKFQTTRIYRGLTVDQNLLIARAAQGSLGDADGRLGWALETVGLARQLTVLAGELIHSHQQWLEICLALATEPELLLLDEPTAGMTPEETALTAEFVVNLNGQGMTVLVVEHDMAFIRHLAGQVTVLHYGRIIAEGSLSEIETNQDVRRIYLGEQ